MKRLVDKKGQELSITTLVLIVLGVIILVLLVLGFTKGWDFIFGKFDLLPGQNLEAVAQSCKISAQGKLTIDYCSFKKVDIDGKTEYVNCRDPRVVQAIDADIRNFDGYPINCVSPYTDNEQCAKLNYNGKVNSVDCSSSTSGQNQIPG